MVKNEKLPWRGGFQWLAPVIQCWIIILLSLVYGSNGCTFRGLWRNCCIHNNYTNVNYFRIFFYEIAISSSVCFQLLAMSQNGHTASTCTVWICMSGLLFYSHSAFIVGREHRERKGDNALCCILSADLYIKFITQYAKLRSFPRHNTEAWRPTITR